jgi:uncharacterized protein (TIGR03435 family)
VIATCTTITAVQTPPNCNPPAPAAARWQDARPSSPAVVLTAAAALFVALVAVALYAGLRGGRRLRWGLIAAAGAVALLVTATSVVLRMHRGRSAPWMEFSIGPAAGDSVSINPAAIRANGITLQTAIAVAHDIPAVRVISPAWVTGTRYSMTAIVDASASHSFRSLLRRELRDRLQLETHVEGRPFDVFVLTASDAPRLERSNNTASTSLQSSAMQIQNGSMERLASALQAVLGKPVIDETNISGFYNFEFDWHEPRDASVTAILRDRFGLHLTRGQRQLEALVVDRIERDAALILLANVGTLTRGLPSHLRQPLARVLAIH